MDKLPIMYDSRQMNKIQKFITENFGTESEFMSHEIYSEYVHTDVQISTNEKGVKSFVTFGMSAREMIPSISGFESIELVMSTSKDFDEKSKEAAVVISDLQTLSKFPFRKNTCFGPGHTINVSKNFKETFGYDFVVFYDLGLTFKMSKSKEVKFLLAIPVYKEERDWMVENDSFMFIDELLAEYGENAFKVDFKREMLIPNYTIDPDELSLMRALGIDSETLRRLSEYLSEMEEKGAEISYEMIAEWVEENR